MAGKCIGAPGNHLKRWSDELSDEAESEDIHSKESDTTNGESSFCPFVLSDSLNRLSPDSAAAESMSKDGQLWIDVLR